MTRPIVEALVTLCRQFGIYERDAICCGDVTVSQCVALLHLLAAPTDVSGLAAHLGVTVSASTRLIDGMKARGWLERQRDTSDGRRVLVVLTAEGEEEARRLQTLSEQRIGAILAKIPPDELPGILHALEVLQRAIVACAADPGAPQGCCSPPTGPHDP